MFVVLYKVSTGGHSRMLEQRWRVFETPEEAHQFILEQKIQEEVIVIKGHTVSLKATITVHQT